MPSVSQSRTRAFLSTASELRLLTGRFFLRFPGVSHWMFSMSSGLRLSCASSPKFVRTTAAFWPVLHTAVVPKLQHESDVATTWSTATGPTKVRCTNASLLFQKIRVAIRTPPRQKRGQIQSRFSNRADFKTSTQTHGDCQRRLCLRASLRRWHNLTSPARRGRLVVQPEAINGRPLRG